MCRYLISFIHVLGKQWNETYDYGVLDVKSARFRERQFKEPYKLPYFMSKWRMTSRNPTEMLLWGQQNTQLVEIQFSFHLVRCLGFQEFVWLWIRKLLYQNYIFVTHCLRVPFVAVNNTKKHVLSKESVLNLKTMQLSVSNNYNFFFSISSKPPPSNCNLVNNITYV